MVKFLQIVGILKRIPRTGWIDGGVYHPESVADHTFRTAILCMLYADIKDLDSLKLLRMALIHDLPEALIGDLIPSQKSTETKKKEENAIFQTLSLVPDIQREQYMAIWNEYQEGKTIEAKTVHQLEKIEMALQAKEYRKLGSLNKNYNQLIESSKDAVNWLELKRLLSFILEG